MINASCTPFFCCMYFWYYKWGLVCLLFTTFQMHLHSSKYFQAHSETLIICNLNYKRRQSPCCIAMPSPLLRRYVLDMRITSLSFMSLHWLCHAHSDQALLQGHHSLNDYHVSSTSRDTRCCRIHSSIFHRFSLDRVACRRGGGELTACYMSHKHDNKQTWTMRCPLTSFRLDKKCYFIAVSEKHLKPWSSNLKLSCCEATVLTTVPPW